MQQGTPDLILTSIKSFRIIIPLLVGGKNDQGPLYTAKAMLALSCMMQSQL